MKLIFLCIFSSFCSVSLQSGVYYITPSPDDCNVDETSRCYLLQQIIDDEVLTHSNESSVTLLLLPGTHVIVETLNFRGSNVSKLIFRPLNEHQQVVIKCQVDANLVFQDLIELRLVSLHFLLCTLQLLKFKREPHHRIQYYDYCDFVFEDDEIPSVNISNCTFLSNNKSIHIQDFTYVLIIDTVFQSNFDTIFFVNKTESIIIIYSVFANNTAQTGVVVASNSFLILQGATFSGNNGNSVLLLNFSDINVCGSSFVQNSGKNGIITVTFSYESFFIFMESIFQGNSASSFGGALNIFQHGSVIEIFDCHFESNSAQFGGALYIGGQFESFDITKTVFIKNNVNKDGGAIYCENTGNSFTFIALDTGSALYNSADRGKGGFAYLSNCKLKISSFRVSNNTAEKGGGIYAENTQFEIGNNFTLTSNFATDCGAALFLVRSQLLIFQSSIVKFSHNVVTSKDGKGGAIFIQDYGNCDQDTKCFLKESSDIDNFIFLNNSASKGSLLYGGLLDRCQPNTVGSSFIKQYSQYDQGHLALTSDPVRLCLCNGDLTPNCTIRETTVAMGRGAVVRLVATAVDQDQNCISSFIRAHYNSDAQLGEGEGRKSADGMSCADLSYHVYTRNTTAKLFIYPEGICEHSEFSRITVHIMLTNCSRGLEMVIDRCECDRRLNVRNCKMGSIQRNGSLWLRYDEHHLKVHRNCPLSYCNTTSDTISLENPDEQCANHRSGVICGACQDNYSIALGGSKCFQCSSSYAFVWLVPVFAVAGVALVALLLVCNMTISHGTLNGLIFYANVISNSGLTSLHNCSIHPILTVFTAWINLDLGIETCFFAEMDTYQKTWLQFVFPLYIWLLVGVVIIACHYSSAAMKVFGKCNMAILATLFLLSYTKILKTIITALDFTEVLQGSADNVSDPLVPYKVWKYDGNIEYLDRKHVPLFIVALVLLVFLFLPYTLLLMFGQCVHSMPIKNKYFGKCTRSTAFISIMDAYHAPYNKKHRYWTGLFLLTRCVLFLTFAINYGTSKLLRNMYVTTFVLMALFILNMFIAMKMYKSLYLSFLELGFLLNLVILSITTLYFFDRNSNSEDIICKSANASISISLLKFIGILFYHAYLRITKTRWAAPIGETFAKYLSKKPKPVPTEGKPSMSNVLNIPSTTSVELREALLASGEFQ